MQDIESCINSIGTETEDEQVIVYIKPNKSQYFNVVREKIKYKITLRSCFLYLCIHFPRKKLTSEYVKKCYVIFMLLLRKANFFEEHEENETHIGNSTYTDAYGVMYDNCKSVIAYEILFNHSLKIICFNLREDNMCNVANFVWSLENILDDDSKYSYCFNYFSNLVDHQDIRDVLIKIFPDDIIDIIFSMMKSAY